MRDSLTTADVANESRLPGASRKRSLGWVALSGAALAVFLCLTAGVETGAFRPDDRSIELKVHHVIGIVDFPVFNAIAFIGGTPVHAVITLIVTAALIAKRTWWSAAFLLIVQIGAILGQGIKLLTARPRPHLFPGALHASGYSFPSGHALSATLLYGALAYLVWIHFGRRTASFLMAVLLVGWALLIGLSRIVLGVHYPTDVEGGIALGLAWLFGTIALVGPAVWNELRTE